MFFLYTGATSRTGRAIARALGSSRGYPSRWNRVGGDVLVRWGSSAGMDADVTLNTSESVSRTADKLRMLETLRDGGISVPPFSVRDDELEYPILGRSRNHRGGTDIAVYMRPDERRGLASHAFYTQFVESAREMRLHVVGNEVVAAALKRGPDHEGHLPIRNHDHGYTFVPFVHTWPHQRRCDTAVAAVRALGLDFGSVDLLILPSDADMVCEVNSSAGCTPRTARAYATGIAKLLEERDVRVGEIDLEKLEVLGNGD